MTTYYNEIDPYVAQWLRNLIAAGHIAPGEVDERSISDVKPSELVGYTQCHFFAGIGGWSLALRLAGWPDDRPVWTGSCPCQPFSNAGKGGGTSDERHLWPHWFHLIRAVRPGVVFGEQVEAAIGYGWLDLVQDDLEGEGYAFAPVGIPAAGVGAPHVRHRLWFVADAHRRQLNGVAIIRGVERHGEGPGRAETCGQPWSCGGSCRCGVVISDSTGPQPGSAPAEAPGHRHPTQSTMWDDCDWLEFSDGKQRPVEPGTFPLANGVLGRVGRLRAYGNAIVPQVAAEVIRAYVECRP